MTRGSHNKTDTSWQKGGKYPHHRSPWRLQASNKFPTMTGRFSGKEIYTVLITLTPNHLSGSFTLLDTSKSGMAKQVVHRLHSGEDSGG